MYLKSSSHMTLASSLAIGSRSDSGEPDRRIDRDFQTRSSTSGIGHDLIELFVTLEQAVHRLQFTQVIGPEL